MELAVCHEGGEIDQGTCDRARRGVQLAVGLDFEGEISKGAT